MVSDRGCESEAAGMHGARHGASRPCCRRGGGGGLGAFAEPAALAALLGKAGHGYDLRREIGEITDGEIEVDAGGLYRVLRRLEDEGFVTSEWSDGGPGPQRRDYRLTAEGRELAEDWIVHLRERQRLSGLLADALTSALKTTDND
ncbi:MAG: PadR family transcriptional regulator [Coriobacteriia bacterium]